MRALALALALLAASVASVFADAPKASIKGPSVVAAGGTIVLDARASVADLPLSWQLKGPDVPFLTLDQDKRKGVVAIVPAASPGVYEFILIAQGVPPGGTELVPHAATLTVTVGSPDPPTPTPQPSPPPIPAPTPVSVSGPLHVTYIADAANVTSADRAMDWQDSTAAALAGLDVRYHYYESNQDEPRALNLLVEATALPCAIIQDAKGHVFKPVLVKPTMADVASAVKSLRGAK